MFEPHSSHESSANYVRKGLEINDEKTFTKFFKVFLLRFRSVHKEVYKFKFWRKISKNYKYLNGIFNQRRYRALRFVGYVNSCKINKG